MCRSKVAIRAWRRARTACWGILRRTSAASRAMSTSADRLRATAPRNAPTVCEPRSSGGRHGLLVLRANLLAATIQPVFDNLVVIPEWPAAGDDIRHPI